LFRSAPFYIENITHIFNEKSYLHEEVNRTEPSPLVSIPWGINYLSAEVNEVGIRIVHGEHNPVGGIQLHHHDRIVLVSMFETFYSSSLTSNPGAAHKCWTRLK